jgi:uncharacterized protein YkwD
MSILVNGAEKNTGYDSAIIEEINIYRIAEGIPPLQLDIRLSKSGTLLAKLVKQLGYMAHDEQISAWPVKYQEKIKEYDINNDGWKTIWMHNLYPTTYVKEHSNYFKGYNGQVGELLTYPLKLDPVSVWFMSDKHRAVLMLPWWKDIGIGTAGGKDSGAVCYVGIRWPVNGSSP